MYRDKIDKGNSECNDPDNCLSSIDWLIKYDGQYSYENQRIDSINSFESNGDTATLTLTMTESRTLHQSGKKTRSGETSQSTFDLVFENGSIKISDIRNR
jgi:ARC6-like, IMS domain